MSDDFETRNDKHFDRALHDELTPSIIGKPKKELTPLDKVVKKAFDKLRIDPDINL